MKTTVRTSGFTGSEPSFLESLPLETLFRTANIFLFTLAFIPLFLTSSLSISLKSGIFLALLWCGALHITGKIPLKSEKSTLLKYPLFAGTGFLFISDFNTFRLLVLLVSIFLFAKLILQKDRTDYLLLYILNLLLLLLGAIITVEFYFSLIFIFSFFTITWCLLLYHLTEQKEETEKILATQQKMRITEEKKNNKALTSHLIWNINLAVCFCIFSALFLYLFFPRFNSGFFRMNSNTPLMTTGFSDTVSLGDIGTINESNRIAFRAEIHRNGKPLKKPLTTLYWRGKSLDYYTESRWEDHLSERQAIPSERKSTFRITPTPQDKEKSAVILDAQIFNENLVNILIFSPGRPLTITAERKHLFRTGENLYIREKPDRNRTYHIKALILTTENPPYILPAGRTKNITTEEEERLKETYLQYPKEEKTLARFADTLLKEKKAAQSTPQAIAESLSEYLQRNYHYTLQLPTPPPSEETPLGTFLTKTKAGHCEYFATTLTLMLRHLGIPARIVNGFLAGEWNEAGGYYIVREKYAHSWVEYYNKGFWHPVDPTPARPELSFSPRSSWITGIAHNIDAIKMLWNRYMILYSWKEQKSLLEGLAKQGKNLRQQGESISTQLSLFIKKLKEGIKTGTIFSKENMLWSILLLSSVFITIMLIRKRGKNTTPLQLSREAGKIERELRKAGITLHPSETFSACLRKHPKLSAVEGLKERINQYHKKRFGRN